MLQVLLPLMGWVRNYHAWLFFDMTDGAIFGPGEDCQAIDMMHVPMHVGHCIDARREGITLGHLLRAEGDKTQLMYDVGDGWTHLLSVKKAFTMEESTGRVELLDGAMQCPPEDSNGARPSANRVLAQAANASVSGLVLRHMCPCALTHNADRQEALA